MHYKAEVYYIHLSQNPSVFQWTLWRETLFSGPASNYLEKDQCSSIWPTEAGMSVSDESDSVPHHITTQFSQCHLFKFPPRLRRPTAIRQTCSSRTRPDSLSSSVLLVRRVIKAEGCDRGSESRSGFSYLKVLWSAGCMSRGTWWRRWGCSWGMRNRWEDSWRREHCRIYLQHAAVFGVSWVWKEKWGMIILQFVAFRCPNSPGKEWITGRRWRY